jgi:ubiquitin-protein ligase
MSVSFNKRLLKEIRVLTLEQNKKPLLENDYLVTFDETNLNKVYAIIKPPKDSLYKHKFIRLNFDIPQEYPHVPPTVSFVNYDGLRIHPCMYEDGRCCATILNTWPSLQSASNNNLEAWTSSFGIETVILTFLSFLDNEPYRHEANAPDNQSYNEFVLYQGWYTCFIRYLENQHLEPELFTKFIYNYLLDNIDDILDDLYNCSELYPEDAYETNCFYIGYYTINYNMIIHTINEWYNYIYYKENAQLQVTHGLEIPSKETCLNNLTCNICFDTQQYTDNITLNCKHQFHNKCLELHIQNNGNICSLCRTDISEQDQMLLKQMWIINPETKRRVKIGSRTYNRLIEEKIIHPF